jgi:3',5'-nucleoside bisphosphate phosphatase
MQKAIDLQMHSHYSDGSKSPTELVKIVRSKKIVVAALTDHNTIHGQYEYQAAAKKFNIKTISGVEIYTTYKTWRLHLLGYKIDINNARLHDELRETQHKRKRQIERLVPKLKRVGLILNISELFAQPATYVGIANIVRLLESDKKNRLTIQRALKKREYDFFEIYNRYFSYKSSCHLPEISIPFRDALELIKHAKGVPILSHPGWQLGFRDDHVITELKKLGLRGIECFSSHHNWNQTAHYQNIAKQNNLIITGGSDYHGDLPGDTIIENYHEYTSLPYDIYENIKAF